MSTIDRTGMSNIEKGSVWVSMGNTINKACLSLLLKGRVPLEVTNVVQIEEGIACRRIGHLGSVGSIKRR